MAETKSLHEKLIDIQQRLKVPKGQVNEFGNFNYRNLEDIEDKVKPHLKEHGLALTFGDEIVEVGGRVYVKATARLTDGKDEILNSAYAREAITPKAKTDDAQLTGACSSYARKYAAGGLFLIDNTKDADSMDNSKPRNDPNAKLAQSKAKLYSALIKAGYGEFKDQKAFIAKVLSKETVDSVAEAEKVIKALEGGNDTAVK